MAVGSGVGRAVVGEGVGSAVVLSGMKQSMSAETAPLRWPRSNTADISRQE